ncbi:MAG TPA: ATP-binding protein [Myxococcales bacterium]|nr:ATP-binding protein [Myxococcales bacterium]
MADKQRLDEAEARNRTAEVHERLVRSIAQVDDAAGALLDCQPNVADLIACGGGAVLTGGDCHPFGETPPDKELLKLASWLRENAPGDVFATDSLPALYPDAGATVTGLLAVRIAKSSADYLLWFRPELLRSVKWAGDPSKPVETGPMGDRLTPRKSFALWQETVRGHSSPWLPLELEAAEKLRVALTEIAHRRGEELARLNLELLRSNQELDAFAYVASHDLKEPLRGVHNFASFLLEDAGAKLDAPEKERLAVIVRLAKRTQSLIESLLHYAKAGRGPLELSSVDLNLAVAEALETLSAHLKESGARVEVGKLPVVLANPEALQEILTNLVSNALKYNDKPDKWIQIGCLVSGEPGFPAKALTSARCFYVRDNGIGIPAAFREDIFRIFRRLHQQTEFGGGTGAGLTIVRKMAQRHGGEVWCDAEDGVGTTFYFTLEAGHA